MVSGLQRPPRMRDGRQAFTLLEIVVVIGVATIFLLGVFSTFHVADQARHMAAEQDLAREACRAKLEELSDLGAVSFGSLPGLHETFFDVPEVPSPTGERLVSSVAGELPGKIIISSQANPPGPHPGASDPTPASPTLLKVTVQVRWLSRVRTARDAGPEAQVVEMSTLIAEGR